MTPGETSPRTLDVEVDPSRILRILGFLVAFFALAGIIGQVLAYRFGHDWGYGLIPEFYLDGENNPPTYFTAVLLLLASVLLAVIAFWKHRSVDRFRWHWGALSVLFLLMSIDEVASLHERLIHPMRALFGADGWLHFTWVIPGAIFVAVVGLAFLGFLRHLERPVRAYVLVAGFLYVAATLGVESVGGRLASAAGQENLAYAVVASVEETLEMAGITLFVYALLRYLADARLLVRFHARPGQASGPQAPGASS